MIYPWKWSQRRTQNSEKGKYVTRCWPVGIKSGVLYLCKENTFIFFFFFWLSEAGWWHSFFITVLSDCLSSRPLRLAWGFYNSPQRKSAASCKEPQVRKVTPQSHPVFCFLCVLCRPRPSCLCACSNTNNACLPDHSPAGLPFTPPLPLESPWGFALLSCFHSLFAWPHLALLMLFRFFLWCFLIGCYSTLNSSLKQADDFCTQLPAFVNFTLYFALSSFPVFQPIAKTFSERRPGHYYVLVPLPKSLLFLWSEFPIASQTIDIPLSCLSLYLSPLCSVRIFVVVFILCFCFGLNSWLAKFRRTPSRYCGSLCGWCREFSHTTPKGSSCPRWDRNYHREIAGH